MTDPTKRPIIVIKKKGGHGGHHGGAWKVAYADFVTAMMALFIVLWLLSSSADTKKAVAGYFKDPSGKSTQTGSDKVGDSDSVAMIDKNNVQKLKEQIEKAIAEQKNLDKLAKQIEITITPDGLRIELIEDKSGTFFQSGSAQLSSTGQDLLGMLAGQLKTLPNRVMIEGHTDAKPYSNDNGYSNWELSADRANSARHLLQNDGVRQDQVSQVRGYADQLLRVKADPLDASNRRISVIVQWIEKAAPVAPVAEARKEAKAGGAAPVAAPGKPAASAAAPAKSVAPVAPAAPATTVVPAAKAPIAKPAAGKISLIDRLKAMLPGKKAGK